MSGMCAKVNAVPESEKKIGKKRGPKDDKIYASVKIDPPVCGRNPEELKRVLCEIIDRYNPRHLTIYDDGHIEFSCIESYKSLLRGESKKEINPSIRSEGN